LKQFVPDFGEVIFGVFNVKLIVRLPFDNLFFFSLGLHQKIEGFAFEEK
jgi:hypothetical protein